MAMLANPFSAAPSQGTPMFGAQGGQQQQQQVQTNAVQQQPNTQTNFNAPNNQTQQFGADGKPIQQNSEEESDDSLLKLDGLWDTDKNEDGTPKTPQPDQGYLPKVDPTKFKEALSKMDFTKSITPEIQAAIQAGGDQAWPAIQQLLNSSLREVVAMNFQTASKMFESGMTTAKDRFTGDIDGRVKSVMVENSLTSSNPIMKDPAHAPMVEAIRNRYQEKYPKATPEQLTAAVNRHFDDLVNKLTTAKNKANIQEVDNTDKLKTGDSTADWEEWGGMKI